MKNNKVGVIVVVLLLALVYTYILIFTNYLDDFLIINLVTLGLIFVICIYFVGLMYSSSKSNNLKVYKAIIENSNTIYIMFDSKNKKILYMSSNASDILGIQTNNKSLVDVAYSIFNMPIVKNEFRNWNGKDQYTSQMLSYSNPKYNHDMWIKIKFNQYMEKNEEYTILEIIDSTKEHDKQHLLISQASDIKARENQLNQITAKSYDMELNINLITNNYDLKYYKKDMLYFGESKNGNYNEKLEEILTYINDSDKDLVYNNLSLESLKEHYTKYELDSIVFRYRLGNELKNNTWLESTIFFLSNRQNSKVSILTKNVTENAESIREQNVLLQNALNDAKIASKSKTDLISTISHDIRIPLTNIIGLSDSLMNKQLKNSELEDIKNINDSSKEVLDIIDGLLDTKNIEKKTDKINVEDYSILKLFNKVEDASKEYIGNKDIDFILNLNNNLPVILKGDYKKIYKSIIQVVLNSIKYTSEGKIEINVKGEKHSNLLDLIVEISDTGSGISEKKLNKIMNSKDGNNGLNSVKNTVELLDGKLEIESKVNEYTKVTLYFKQEIVEDNKVRELLNSNKTAETFDLSNKKILVVDDNRVNLKVASKILETYNINISLAESGEEALDIVKNDLTFDLIMLDQMMPGLDGNETLNQFKKIDNFNIPVIVLTADAIIGQKEKYLSEYGFDDYLSKPIDKIELSRVLKKYLKNK